MNMLRSEDDVSAPLYLTGNRQLLYWSHILDEARVLIMLEIKIQSSVNESKPFQLRSW